MNSQLPLTPAEIFFSSKAVKVLYNLQQLLKCQLSVSHTQKQWQPKSLYKRSVAHNSSFVLSIHGSLLLFCIRNKMSTGQHNSHRLMEESWMTKKKVPQRLLVNAQSKTMCVTTMLPIQKSAASIYISMSWSRIRLPETWKVLNAK